MSVPVSRCVHLRPRAVVRPGACAAEVRYRDVAKGGRLPCLTLAGGEDRSSACSKFEPVPQAELEAEARMLEQAFERFEQGRCPQCDAELIRAESHEAVRWTCPTHGAVASGCKRASL